MIDPLFLVTTLALNVTPGPDMLYVIARSLGEGRRAGLVSALGISAGCLVHACLVTFGLSQVLRQAPLAYDVVRYAGAAYLVYLGVTSLVRRTRALELPAAKRASLRRIFWQGVVTNVLNPKVALFFLAFLPQFVHADAGHVMLQLLALSLWFNISGTAVNALVALGVSHVRRWLTTSRRAQVAVQRVPGVVFIGLGARLAIARGTT